MARRSGRAGRRRDQTPAGYQDKAGSGCAAVKLGGVQHGDRDDAEPALVDTRASCANGIGKRLTSWSSSC